MVGNIGHARRCVVFVLSLAHVERTSQGFTLGERYIFLLNGDATISHSDSVVVAMKF